MASVVQRPTPVAFQHVAPPVLVKFLLDSRFVSVSSDILHGALVIVSVTSTKGAFTRPILSADTEKAVEKRVGELELVPIFLVTNIEAMDIREDPRESSHLSCCDCITMESYCSYFLEL